MKLRFDEQHPQPSDPLMSSSRVPGNSSDYKLSYTESCFHGHIHHLFLFCGTAGTRRVCNAAQTIDKQSQVIRNL